ncbi:hypothetical protein [Rhizorhabdus histidinilytica]|uniref:hypothetical protein n=1 Tax=Rhizorhabdus histidinilytica TaxID=439228 RepID=UPI00321FA59E
MIIIIQGPPACGKTRNAERLRRHFGCQRIVDGWSARGHGSDKYRRTEPATLYGRPNPAAALSGPVRSGDLVLTTDTPDAIFGAKSLQGQSFSVLSFEAAMAALGGQG